MSDFANHFVGPAGGRLGTIAIRVNASTYSPGFSCADMARGKQDIHEQLDDVYDEASDEGMSEDEQDEILGPVTDAAEDFYASGGVVFIVQP